MSAKDLIRWFNLQEANTSEETSFEDEKLLTCYLTKIYHYSEVRNAYWNSTSNLYPGDHAFHYDFSVIKNRIEHARKKGSYFQIHEVPCLVLGGKDDALVIHDYTPRTIRPFAGSQRKIEIIEDIDNLNIEELYQWLKGKIKHINAFITEEKKLQPFKSPLIRYLSYTNGNGYRLGYTKRTNEIDIEPMLFVLNKFHNLLIEKS